MDIISQTTQILEQSVELMKNPAVSGAVNGFLGWMKNIFSNNKRAQQRLEMIEKMEANEEIIKGLQTNLDDLLYENEELKKQFEGKLAELQEQLQNAGVQITKTNTMNITGDGNIGLQDINGGDINININK